MHKALFIRIISLTSALLITLIVVAYLYGLRLNFSKSYPIGIYQKIQKQTIQKGDMVMLCPKNSPTMQMALLRGYLLKGFCEGGYYPLLKKVVATSGDEITFKKYLYVNGIKIPNSQRYQYDAKMQLLPQPTYEAKRLKQSELFVMSDHFAKSFDSRYFGVVSQEDVISHMKALYTIDH